MGRSAGLTTPPEALDPAFGAGLVRGAESLSNRMSGCKMGLPSGLRRGRRVVAEPGGCCDRVGATEMEFHARCAGLQEAVFTLSENGPHSASSFKATDVIRAPMSGTWPYSMLLVLP